MVLRKILGFIITTLLSAIILTFLMTLKENYGMVETFGFILMFSAPGILVLGVPVSLFSDHLTKKLSGRNRYFRAFFIHIIFGLILGIIISFIAEGEFYLVSSLIATSIFWLVDEALRKKINNNANKVSL
jgi:hypothetical protein